jgi:hypothetical protein
MLNAHANCHQGGIPVRAQANGLTTLEIWWT